MFYKTPGCLHKMQNSVYKAFTDRVEGIQKSPARTGGAAMVVGRYFEYTLSKEQKVCHLHPHILSRSKEQKVGKGKAAKHQKIQLQISFLDEPLQNLYRTKKTAASRFLRSGKGFNPLLCLYFSFLSKTIFYDFEHLKIPETTNGWPPAA